MLMTCRLPLVNGLTPIETIALNHDVDDDDDYYYAEHTVPTPMDFRIYSCFVAFLCKIPIFPMNSIN